MKRRLNKEWLSRAASEVPMVWGPEHRLEVSSGAAEGQGLVDRMEALRLSCLHVLGAMAAETRRDWSVVGG